MVYDPDNKQRKATLCASSGNTIILSSSVPKFSQWNQHGTWNTLVEAIKLHYGHLNFFEDFNQNIFSA